MGGNEEATRISGINVNKIKLIVYTLLQSAGRFFRNHDSVLIRHRAAHVRHRFEMDAIAAVISAVLPERRRRTITGTILGAAIMGVLRNALVLLSIKSHWQNLIIGFVIIITVAADQLKEQRQIK